MNAKKIIILTILLLITSIIITLTTTNSKKVSNKKTQSSQKKVFEQSKKIIKKHPEIKNTSTQIISPKVEKINPKSSNNRTSKTSNVPSNFKKHRQEKEASINQPSKLTQKRIDAMKTFYENQNNLIKIRNDKKLKQAPLRNAKKFNRYQMTQQEIESRKKTITNKNQQL